MNYLKSFVAVLLTFLVSLTFAAEPLVQEHFSIQQVDGLVITIPGAAPQEISKALSSHHSDLEKQRTDIAQQIENTKIGTKDALLAAILPGGLIYLANKKQRHNLAKANLQDISSQLAELRADMNHFALQSSTQSFALLK